MQGRGAKRKEGVGKRRRARQIAVQMLYQQELGGSTLEQIFAGYALEDYVRETDSAAVAKEAVKPSPTRRGGAARSDAASLEASELADSFSYARELVEGVTVHGEAIMVAGEDRVALLGRADRNH